MDYIYPINMNLANKNMKLNLPSKTSQVYNIMKEISERESKSTTF